MNRFKLTRRLATCLLLWAALSTSALASNPTAFVPYLERPEVLAFIDEQVRVHGLDRSWLMDALAQAQYSESAERLNTPSLRPAWQMSWDEYRARKLTEPRIRGGVQFMQTHQDTLARAQAQWGVPPEIIAAVIGVETLYGRYTGRLRALDVLMTLSFDYTRRAELFRSELSHYLRWCQQEGISPSEPRASHASALGLPQFMPSSLRRYAVDFDGDGHIDLIQSVADAIGSVAAFLATHGWQRQEPVLLPVQPNPALPHQADQGITAKRSWSELRVRGVELAQTATLAPDTPVLLIELANTVPETPEAERAPSPAPDSEPGAAPLPSQWRVGTRNFSALLHYNRSYFYAASVADLAQVLREQSTGSVAEVIKASP